MSTRRRKGKTLMEVFARENPPPVPLAAVSVYSRDMREWRTYDIPVTLDQLSAARNLYLEDLEEAIRQNLLIGYPPQTVARSALLRAAPQLDSFDLIVAGFAVTNDRVRFDGNLLPLSPRWKRAKKIAKAAKVGF